MFGLNLTPAIWNKSTRSNGGTGCVEVAVIHGAISVRDTKKNGRGPALVFTPEEWRAFVGGVKDGEFDFV